MIGVKHPEMTHVECCSTSSPQDILEKLRLQHPGAPPLLLANDTFLQGRTASATVGAAISLKVHLNKCGVYTRTSHIVIDVLNSLGVQIVSADCQLQAALLVQTSTLQHTPIQRLIKTSYSSSATYRTPI